MASSGGEDGGIKRVSERGKIFPIRFQVLITEANLQFTLEIVEKLVKLGKCVQFSFHFAFMYDGQLGHLIRAWIHAVWLASDPVTARNGTTYRK